MPIEATLAAAQADVAAGDLATARRRLRDLLRAVPERLDVRERLAQLYRDDGDHVQAGRWDYLTEARDAAETQAFERATPDLRYRMHLLQWPADPEDAPTPIARHRLAELLAEARARTGDHRLTYPRAHPGHTRRSRRLPARLTVAALAVAVGLFLIGAADGVRVLVSALP